MQEEKRSREGKLRDRLAKKRKAKEAEMQQAALSERVSDLAQGSTDQCSSAQNQTSTLRAWQSYASVSPFSKGTSDGAFD